MTIVRRQITPAGVFSQAAYDAVFPFIQHLIWGDLHQWRSWNRMHGLPRVVPHSDIPGVFKEGALGRHHSVMPMMEVT